MPRSRRAYTTTDTPPALGHDEAAAREGEQQSPMLLADAPVDGWTAPRAVAYTAPQDIPAPSQNLDDPDLPFWLALNRVKGIGPARFKLLLDAFGSAEAAWRGSTTSWLAAGLDTRTATGLEQQRKRIVPEAEVERLVKLRVAVLRLTDTAYPRLLREITLPPPVLYVRGALTPEDDWAIAIVGTRRATAYGRQITDALPRSWPSRASPSPVDLLAASTRMPTPPRSTPVGAPLPSLAAAPTSSTRQRTPSLPRASSKVAVVSSPNSLR